MFLNFIFHFIILYIIYLKTYRCRSYVLLMLFFGLFYAIPQFKYHMFIIIVLIVVCITWYSKISAYKELIGTIKYVPYNQSSL